MKLLNGQMLIPNFQDFCLWGPPKPNSLIGNTEGEAVAWCTKPGRGTRLIPAGALTGVQFMKTPAYVQVRWTRCCVHSYI
jgi:hypothetical protein